MATLSSTNRPTPEHIFNTLFAYQQTYALRAGIDLDIFSAIAGGATEIASLATKTGAAERGLQALCNYLAALGFLTKQGTNYGLSQDSAIFLNKRSSAYMGSISDFFTNDHIVGNFAKLTEAVKKG